MPDGPLISLRTKAIGALSIVALAPALMSASPALAQSGPEVTVGTGDPTPDGDSADDPNWTPPDAPGSTPLQDRGGVTDTDAPDNNAEADPLDSDTDGDDPGGHPLAPAAPDPAAPVDAGAGNTAVTGPAASQPPVSDTAPPPATSTPPPTATAVVPPPVKPADPPKRARHHRRTRPAPSRPAPARAAIGTQPQSHRASTPTAAPSPPTEARPAVTRNSRTLVSGKTYRVRPGDSLWAIARDTAGPSAPPGRVAALVHQLWLLNSSRIVSGDPNMLAIDTVLKLP